MLRKKQLLAADAKPADSSDASIQSAKSQDAEAAKQADAAALAAAEAKANDLLKQIRAGASFEDIAKKSSDGPSAAQGGDLGVFKRGALAKELEDKTFAMKAGEVTDVIRTKQGYVILKVVNHQSAGIPPLKEIEPQGSGRSVLSKAATRAPRLSHQAARRSVHRLQNGLCGFRRQPEPDQAHRNRHRESLRNQESEKEEKESLGNSNLASSIQPTNQIELSFRSGIFARSSCGARTTLHSAVIPHSDLHC